MRAHMHQRIGLEDVAEPEREGEQCVARRERWIVIGGAAVARTATVRRKRDQHIAEARGAEAEGAVTAIGIIGRIAP